MNRIIDRLLELIVVLMISCIAVIMIALTIGAVREIL